MDRERYYFSGSESDTCYPLRHCLDDTILFLAKRDKDKNYFYCKAKKEVYLSLMDNGERSCGKTCDEYEPKNKKNGMCIYRTYCYYQTNIKYLKKGNRAIKVKE